MADISLTRDINHDHFINHKVQCVKKRESHIAWLLLHIVGASDCASLNIYICFKMTIKVNVYQYF